MKVGDRVVYYMGQAVGSPSYAQGVRQIGTIVEDRNDRWLVSADEEGRFLGDAGSLVSVLKEGAVPFTSEFSIDGVPCTAEEMEQAMGEEDDFQ